MPNPQPHPDAVTGAETRLVADAEAVVELMERGILPSRNDVRDIAALLRALLASLATLRGERDALLAIVNADRTAVCSECLSEALSEEGRVQLYQQLLRDGLSDAEARGTSWPAEPCNHNRLLRTAIDAARAPQGRTE
jgi:hypothetical protein